MLQILKELISWLRERFHDLIDEIFIAIILAILSYLFYTFRDKIVPLLSRALTTITVVYQSNPVFYGSIFFSTLFILIVFFIILTNSQRNRIKAGEIYNLPKGEDFDVFYRDIKKSVLIKYEWIDESLPKGLDLVVRDKSQKNKRIAYILEPSDNIVLNENNIKSILYTIRRSKIDTCYYITRTRRSFFDNKKLNKSNIHFKIYNEILLRDIDFEKYLIGIIKEWNDGALFYKYINLVGKDNVGTVYIPLDKGIDHLLQENGNGSFIALLGDFGTGKTTFLRHYSSILAQQYLISPVIHRIPLLINLKEFELHRDLTKLILNTLLKYGVNCNSDLLADEILRNKILLILDGLDEMSLATDRATIQKNIRIIENAASLPNCNLIVSCRLHFFRDSREENQFRAFSIIYIQKWGEEELIEYLQKTSSDKWETSLRFIKNTYNLEELAQTPIFLNMITSSIGRLSTEVDNLPSDLYFAYTNQWIQTQNYKTVLDSDQKTEFMEHLAWKMICDRRRFISWSELRNEVQEKYRLGVPDVDRFDNDIRTCSFLHRQNGDYSFIHKSFMEFFIAQYLSKCVESDHIEPLSMIELPSEVIMFLSEMLDSLSMYERLHLWLEYREAPDFASSRRNSAHILRLINRSPMRIQEKSKWIDSVEKLVEQINDSSDIKRQWKAIVTLGWLRTKETCAILRVFLTNGIKDQRIIRITMIILGLMGDTESIYYILQLFNSTDIKIRQNCAVALGLLGDKSVIPDLIKLLKDENDFRVRRSTIWALETIDPIASGDVLSTTALDDTNLEVRQYAALAIGRIGGSSSLDILDTLLRHEKVSIVRCSALESVGRIGGDNALIIAENMLNDSDINVRITAEHVVNELRAL